MKHGWLFVAAAVLLGGCEAAYPYAPGSLAASSVPAANETLTPEEAFFPEKFAAGEASAAPDGTPPPLPEALPAPAAEAPEPPASAPRMAAKAPPQPGSLQPIEPAAPELPALQPLGHHTPPAPPAPKAGPGAHRLPQPPHAEPLPPVAGPLKKQDSPDKRPVAAGGKALPSTGSQPEHSDKGEIPPEPPAKG